MIPIKKIQNWMKENNKDILLINRTDEFLSEYIAPYAERLNWISNFSGSAGRAIIEQDKAYLFVDGRYTYQAQEQVNTSFYKIKYFKDYWSHLRNYKHEKKIIAYDGNLHSIDEIEKIYNIFYNTEILLELLDKNPIDLNWKNQPSQPIAKAFFHEIRYAGETSLNKIKKIQHHLQLTLIDYYILSSLDSIAWLLNIRGNDIKFTPLLCCYVIIPKKGKVELFVDETKIKSFRRELEFLVNIHSFKNVNQYIKNLDSKKSVGMDKKETSFYFKKICSNNGLTINYLSNPCIYPKAIKNSFELDGARRANLRDGVSISRFLYWLKKKIQIEEIDEIQAAVYLYNLRKKNELFYSLSFDTISAFGSNASYPHYRVTNKSNLSFKNNSIYLIDSGAQYKDGTTDITRTIVFGKPSKEQKDRFTRVLKGHIAISESKFNIDTKGSQLDPLARKYLNEIGCDYDHGTGHGIGSFLSVHEGPQRIAKSHDQSDGFIKEGMILSNEPGYYKEGQYGIRIENLIICCLTKSGKLYFENISWAPIDRDLINVSLLNETEIKWVNEYHQKVYDKISPNLISEENKWLYLVTRPLQKG